MKTFATDLDRLAALMRNDPSVRVASLCHRISGDEADNPNRVKVVRNAAGDALYFSRATIPWPREHFRGGAQSMPASGNWYRHIGVYAYRTAFLHQYVTWQPAPQEQPRQSRQQRRRPPRHSSRTGR